MDKHGLIDQAKFIHSLTNKLNTNVMDYVDTEAMYGVYYTSHTKYANSSKESIKARIVEIRHELRNLYKMME